MSSDIRSKIAFYRSARRLDSGAGMSVFRDDHALSDTSMRLSDYVLQTFLVNIFVSHRNFFHYQDG